MKVSICGIGANIDTYVSVMAACIDNLKQKPTEFEVVVLNFSEVDAIVKKIKLKLKEKQETECYFHADKVGITCKSISYISEETFKECDAIDVTALPKEETAEVLAIALRRRNKVYCLRWDDGAKTEKTVSVDPYKYTDLMKSKVFQKLRNLTKTLQTILMALFVCLVAFGIAVFLGITRVWSIDDKMLNILGFLIGVAGIWLSFISLKNTPTG
jgi:hypothetical protein